jgi:hypothetical protein
LGASSPIRALIGRAISLPTPLLALYPDLALVRWRRGGLPVYIAGWFLGQRSVAAITLWRVVFLAAETELAPELLLHELRHAYQFQASAAFPLLYLWESMRRGYVDNRYEADARWYAARRLRGDN